MVCDKCNFRGTERCPLETDEEMTSDEVLSVIYECEDGYHDWELKKNGQ